jgi:hypothetical protein
MAVRADSDALRMCASSDNRWSYTLRFVGRKSICPPTHADDSWLGCPAMLFRNLRW